MNEENGGEVFDEVAASYDDVFTDSAIGRLMRAAVWRHVDAAFEPGMRVLDLGCGTGTDAVHLAERGVEVIGVDSSAQMIERARRRVDEAGLRERVTLHHLPIERLAELEQGASASAPLFDGALSNFGVLNCVEDPSGVASSLAARLRSGASVFVCMMGPWVPWEWLWYLALGHPEKAFRRLGRDGAEWHGIRIRYPWIGTLASAFGPLLRRRSVVAVGALYPGSYAENAAGRWPKVVEALDALERTIEDLPPLPWLADHYLMRLERR